MIDTERLREIRAYADKASPSEPWLQGYVRDLLAALDEERAGWERVDALLCDPTHAHRMISRREVIRAYRGQES